MSSESTPVLVLLSASFVTSSKFESIQDSFATNDRIKILNSTKILLNETQSQLLPIPNASQFCDGSIASYLLQSDTEIDFETIEKSVKIGKTDIFKTKDRYFVTQLKQILFPQKPALEQTLIICNPPLSEDHLNEMNEELKLKGIFILYQAEISSENNSNLKSIFNDEEKEEAVACTVMLFESFARIYQV
eukprot:297910_1